MIVQLFRVLQGTTDGLRKEILQNINEGRYTIPKAVELIENRKKIRTLKEVFLSVTESTDETAPLLYPNHFERIEEFCSMFLH